MSARDILRKVTAKAIANGAEIVTEIPATIFNVVVVYRRPDGSTGSVCSSADAYADTIAYYQGEHGYAIVEEDWRAFCGGCKGKGRVPMAKRAGYKRCPVCLGKRPEWEATREEAQRASR